MAVVPARRRKPRDKAKVESGVLVVERWILAALNQRPFRKAEGTRQSLFEALDKPALRALPPERYEIEPSRDPDPVGDASLL